MTQHATRYSLVIKAMYSQLQQLCQIARGCHHAARAPKIPQVFCSPDLLLFDRTIPSLVTGSPYFISPRLVQTTGRGLEYLRLIDRWITLIPNMKQEGVTLIRVKQGIQPIQPIQGIGKYNPQVGKTLLTNLTNDIQGIHPTSSNPSNIPGAVAHFALFQPL